VSGANGSGSSSTGDPLRVQTVSLSAILIALAGLAQLLYFSKTLVLRYPDAC
jgi:hypothetical protein